MLQNILALALCALCLVFFAGARADEPGRPNDRLGHSLSVGVVAADFDYRESDEGERLNREHGVLPGLNLRWQVAGSRYFAEAEYEYLDDAVDYDGTTQAGAAVSSNTDEVILRAVAVAGWRYESRGGIEYHMLGGFGYREWQRDIQGTPGVSGLEETYTFGYGQLGLRALYRSSEQHSWQLELSARRPFDARVRVEFENELDPARLDLPERTTLNAALSWRYAFSATLGLETELFYRAWDFGRSAEQELTQGGTSVGTLFEPASETSISGLSVRLVKSFH